MTGFVAIVRTGSRTDRPALVAAGATAVLSWAELASSTEPDDVPAVLFDQPDLRAHLDLDRLGPELAAALAALTSIDPSIEAAAGVDRDVVIATVRPVTDTLKLVDEAGFLTGTALRDEHRFVGTPIAARLRVLRALSREPAGGEPVRSDPSAVAVLAALVDRGATVFASSS